MPRWLAPVLVAVLVAGAALAGPAAREASAQGLPAPPQITVEPGCGFERFEGAGPLTPLTFHLRNWSPNSSVSIVWGTESQPVPVVVGAYGAADPPLTFPWGSSDVPVHAFDTNNPSVEARTLFRVPCVPAIRATPTCDEPADPAAPRQITITVDGFGWRPEDGAVAVALLARDATGNETVLSEFERIDPSTDPAAYSRFRVVLDQTPSDRIAGGPLMALPAGVYIVAAIQAQRDRVETEFVVPCPQLVLQPNCGEDGRPLDTYDVLLTGRGYRPGHRVEIIFSADNQPQVFQFDVDLPPSGELTYPDGAQVRIEPFRRPAGQYVVRARQTSGDFILREGTAVFSVPCVIPTAEATPDCGPPALQGDVERRYSITVTGTDFEPGSVQIVFDALGPAPETFPAAVGRDRSFTQPINPLPRPAAAGGYEIRVTQQKADGTVTVVPIMFSVPCEPAEPELSARCDPEDTTQPDLAQVVITGAGFFVGPVEIIAGTSTQPPVTTDDSGRFEHRLPAAGLPPGPLEIVGTQRDVNLVIVAQAPVTLILPCGTPLEPTIAVTPGNGPPGFVVIVTGFGFRSGSTVALSWDRGIARQPIVLQAGDDGTFTQQVLVFHHDFAGPRNLVATSTDDPARFEPLTAPYVVVPGRGSPPIFTGGLFGADETIVIRR